MAYEIVNNEVSNNPNVAIGIRFPFNSAGVFSKTYTTIEQSKSNLKNLLLTMRGERYEQPLFGTDLIHLIFEPATELTIGSIRETIADSISDWLPYITVNDIITDTYETDPSLTNQIHVLIKYLVTSKNSEQELILFSTETGQLIVE